MSSELQAVLDQIDNDREQALERLFDLLRIPSISTDPAYNEDTARCAQFMANQLSEIGFDASVRGTTGHPMVVAHHAGPADPPDAPHVLYYGHYDVQPPDPLDEWKSPPFEPVLVEGDHGQRIVARGAVDDKGQLMTFIEAFRAWRAVHGELPIKVTVLLEGEEESGSPSLDPFLEANRDELKADVCLVCDTGMWDINTPAITYMLRGLVYAEVTLRGPGHDLHSGMYGGTVINPINALTEVLAQLHDADGRVLIPGFYDDVQEVGEAEAQQWNDLGFDAAAFLASAGLAQSVGESGRSPLERIWSRPTCDINGIIGGYTGQGAKTVIACKASAKVSCRLVADQDPDKVFDGLKQFFQQRTPPDCEWEFECHGLSPAIRVPTDSPYLQAALRGLESVYDKQPVLIGCGGSIPLVGSVRRLLEIDSLLVGFGLDDDRVHSPNEKFERQCFEQGVRSQAAILSELARLGQPAVST